MSHILFNDEQSLICLYFLLLGLEVFTTFNVSVAANNSFGIGTYSQPIQVKTLESSKYF